LLPKRQVRNLIKKGSLKRIGHRQNRKQVEGLDLSKVIYTSGVYSAQSTAKPCFRISLQNGAGTMSNDKTLYARLGGYDAIAAVVDNLLPRLMSARHGCHG
jgi:hypothetical protein